MHEQPGDDDDHDNNMRGTHNLQTTKLNGTSFISGSGRRGRLKDYDKEVSEGCCMFWRR